MNRPLHVPVLPQQVLDLLEIQPGSVVVDATLGLAGHGSAIARRLGATGTLIGFDRDPQAMQLQALREELGNAMPTVRLVPRPFSSAGQELAPTSLDVLFADFGVSSLQLDEPQRGFSFRHDAPLDMRMDTREGETAAQVVNQVDEEELADLIYEFGEERRSRRIARAIVRARPILTTAELANVISAAAPAMKGDHLHPATLTFQAIRIRVNDELGEIRSLLESAPSLLKSGGRLGCISFHSLEDRLVKDALRSGAKDGIWEVVTRKPAVADEAEQQRNPRARSAKFRVAIRLAEGTKKHRKVPPEGGSTRGRR